MENIKIKKISVYKERKKERKKERNGKWKEETLDQLTKKNDWRKKDKKEKRKKF